MNDLVVGDVHATVDELSDCQALVDGLAGVLVEHQVDRVVLLGDQLNAHGVVRVEVLAFWRQALQQLLQRVDEVAMLVGNHDLAGNYRDTSLLAFWDMPGVTVVDRPLNLGRVLHLPYHRDPEAFRKACRDTPRPTAYAHQTFAGGRYENGYPAPDGVDPTDLPQERFVSGHLHTPQSPPKVTYVGAPRWRSKDDANVDRAVWLFQVDSAGRIVKETPFDTSQWCRKILQFVDREGAQLNPLPLGDGRYDQRVEVHGSKAYVELRTALWEQAGAKVRSFRTDLTTAPEVRESDGVATAFQKFVSTWKAPGGTSGDVLLGMARDRLGSMVG